jgi:RimJ/RimL family protein N-acetyltransferase
MSKSKTYHLGYEKKCNPDGLDRIVSIKLSSREEPIGFFSLYGKTKNSECFDSGNTCSMSISIDEEHQGRGLSKMMIKHMVEKIREEYPQIRDDQYIFIDADASDGFWEKIGMKENPNYEDYEDSSEEGCGYEKRITFKNLEKFVKKSPSKKRSRSRSRSRSSTRTRKGGSRKTKRNNKKIKML